MLALIIVAELLRQEGTGQMIPRAPLVPNRPQYEHPGGPVGPRNTPAIGLDKIIKHHCISVECRLYCNPENMMRPPWCVRMETPIDGYIQLQPQLVD